MWLKRNPLNIMQQPKWEKNLKKNRNMYNSITLLYNSNYHNIVAFFSNFIYLFIYLFLAALGLRCCTRAFSSCGEQGLLFIAVHGLLIAVASLVAEHRL